MSLNGIQNLKKDDLVADEEFSAATADTEHLVHVRLQQRSGRKTLTTIQGLREDFDKAKIARYWKKQFNTNGTVVEDDQHGSIIQLQGDQRELVAKSLVRDGFAKEKSVKVHGF